MMNGRSDENVGAVALGYCGDEGAIKVVHGGRRVLSHEGVMDVDGDLVDLLFDLLNGQGQKFDDGISFILVDEAVRRGDFDQFVRTVERGGRPPLPDGFNECWDDRLTAYDD